MKTSSSNVLNSCYSTWEAHRAGPPSLTATTSGPEMAEKQKIGRERGRKAKPRPRSRATTEMRPREGLTAAEWRPRCGQETAVCQPSGDYETAEMRSRDRHDQEMAKNTTRPRNGRNRQWRPNTTVEKAEKRPRCGWKVAAESQSRPRYERVEADSDG